jgi:hypothetical protein
MTIQPAIGDQLRIKVLAENREWGYNPAPDGTIVTVRDFGRITYGRTNNFGLRPGVYLNRCWLDVELDGKVESISHCHLEGLKGEYVGSDAFENRATDRIGDLPSTPIWEEDIVVAPAERQYPEPRDGLVVQGIDYGWVHGLDYARLSSSADAGWYTSYPIRDLVLKRRGPVWTYYNDPASLDLSDADLINLHKRLGLAREQCNPRTNDYSWTVSEALEDIRAGKVDAISASPGLFGASASLSIYRFDDPKVGVKARAATIAGWAGATPESLAEYDKPHLEQRARVDALLRDHARR